MSVSVPAILDYVVSLNPAGRLSKDEGVIYGSPDCAVSRMVVAWMPTVAAIKHAISENCQVILSHEALTFHDYFAQSSSPEPWTADRARLSLLDEHGITVVRAHGTVDPTHVLPAFIKAIGLSAPAQGGKVWSFHNEEPIELGALSKKVSAGLGIGELRVTGDPGQVLTRVGTMIGGLGLDRHIKSWEECLMGLDVQVIVAGETSDFAQRFAVDSDVALIETCHSASEEPGLKVLAADIGAQFKGDVEVVFHKEIVPWSTL